MATFFRDSSLFASRNGKPLFGEKKVELEEYVHTDEQLPTDDDEVEITDVREVHGDVNAEPDTNTAENTMDNSLDNAEDTAHSEDTDDAGNRSMQYLLNTIAHLNERNSKLQGQLNIAEKQNKHLAAELVTKSESVESLKGHLSRIRSSVKSSHALFSELRAQLAANTGSAADALTELESTKKSIVKQHEVIATLKNLLAKIKTELTSNEMAMREKNTVISNLNRQNNELAGQLTEQKLANTALQRTIADRALSYEETIMEEAGKYTELINKYSTDTRVHFQEWETFKATVFEKFAESLDSGRKALGATRENLNENFNDLALRLTALTATTESVSVQVSRHSEHTASTHSELLCALSDVDKNLSTSLTDCNDIVVKKMGFLAGKEDILQEIKIVLNAVDCVAAKEKEIVELKNERRNLENVVAEFERNVANLVADGEKKSATINDTRAKLEMVQLESINMEKEKNDVLHKLKQDSNALTKALDEFRVKMETAKNEHDKKVQQLKEAASKVEAKNIKLFNEEKNKNARLERELEHLQTVLQTEKEKLKHQLELFTTCNAKIEQLEQQLTTYKSDHSSSDEIKKLNSKIDLLRDNVAEKQKLVDSLRSALYENNKTVSNLEEKIKTSQKHLNQPLPSVPLPPPAPLPPIFPESRTSTVIKKEPLSQEKPKKPKSKRAKPTVPSKIKQATTKRGSKRKLLDSSQDSTKSQTLQKKRTDSVKKSILEDLDIFNEFVAMDMMESIGKPNW